MVDVLEHYDFPGLQRKIATLLGRSPETG
jgi:hypothetical protein